MIPYDPDSYPQGPKAYHDGYGYRYNTTTTTLELCTDTTPNTDITRYLVVSDDIKPCENRKERRKAKALARRTKHN